MSIDDSRSDKPREPSAEDQTVSTAALCESGEDSATSPLPVSTAHEEQPNDRTLIRETGAGEAAGIAEAVAKTLLEEVRILLKNHSLDREASSKEDANSMNNQPDNIRRFNEDADKPSLSAKPTIEKSWEEVTKEVASLDDGRIKGWKEDIDTLLVFAGLFSAVVTAFTIESYQWLEQKPEDATVALLTQVLLKMNNEPIFSPSESKVSAYVVQINVLWFLSLVIALVDALFALLCKQWLREHSRHTLTRTPSEALALRWLRIQSLERWHVPKIMASLPILLEVAVFLFLAGVLVLLWDRHWVVFAVALVVVGLAVLFYLGATILPTVNIIRQALQITPWLREMRTRKSTGYSPIDLVTSLPPMEYMCPFKSPQAWAAFRCFRLISRIPGFIRALYTSCRKEYIFSHLDHDSKPVKSSEWAFNGTMSSLSNWSSADLELIQRYDIELAPPLYELNAFRWVVAEFRDSPIMIPHLQNILRALPIHLVMPAVLDQWFFLPHREWSHDDIDAVLPSHGQEGSVVYRRKTFLGPQRETPLFNQLLHFASVLKGAKDIPSWDRRRLIELFQQLQNGLEPHISDLNGIGLPIYAIDHLPEFLSLSNLDWVCGKSLISPTNDMYLATLLYWVAEYIIGSSPDYALRIPTATTNSAFVRSGAGFELVSKLHNITLERKYYESCDYDTILQLAESIDIVRRVHQLPEDYFKPIPQIFPLSLHRLQETLNRLSPAESDFQYLDSFSRHWSIVLEYPKAHLVDILSQHIINYPQSAAEPSTDAQSSKVSPLVMSEAGLKLITFVNNQFVEDAGFRKLMMSGTAYEREREAWIKALELVRLARNLEPDYFRTPPEYGTDSVKSISRQQLANGAYADDLSTPSYGSGGVECSYGSTVRSNDELFPESRKTEGAARVLDDARHTGEVGSIQLHSQVGEGGESDGKSGERTIGGLGADTKV